MTNRPNIHYHTIKSNLKWLPVFPWQPVLKIAGSMSTSFNNEITFEMMY